MLTPFEELFLHVHWPNKQKATPPSPDSGQRIRRIRQWTEQEFHVALAYFKKTVFREGQNWTRALYLDEVDGKKRLTVMHLPKELPKYRRSRTYEEIFGVKESEESNQQRRPPIPRKDF